MPPRYNTTTSAGGRSGERPTAGSYQPTRGGGSSHQQSTGPGSQPASRGISTQPDRPTVPYQDGLARLLQNSRRGGVLDREELDRPVSSSESESGSESEDEQRGPGSVNDDGSGQDEEEDESPQEESTSEEESDDEDVPQPVAQSSTNQASQASHPNPGGGLSNEEALAFVRHFAAQGAKRKRDP